MESGTWNSAVNRSLFPAPCPDSIQDVMTALRGTSVTLSASTISSPWFPGHTLRIPVQRTSCFTPTFIFYRHLCQKNSPNKSVMAPHRIFGMVLADPLQLRMFYDSMIPIYTLNLQPHNPGYTHSTGNIHPSRRKEETAHSSLPQHCKLF